MSVSGMAAFLKCATHDEDAVDQQQRTVTVTVTVLEELGGREGRGVWWDTRPESADSAAWPAKNGG